MTDGKKQARLDVQSALLGVVVSWGANGLLLEEKGSSRILSHLSPMLNNSDMFNIES